MADELVVVLAGRLHLDRPDRTVTLEPLDVFRAGGPAARPQDETAQGTTGARSAVEAPDTARAPDPGPPRSGARAFFGGR